MGILNKIFGGRQTEGTCRYCGDILVRCDACGETWCSTCVSRGRGHYKKIPPQLAMILSLGPLKDKCFYCGALGKIRPLASSKGQTKTYEMRPLNKDKRPNEANELAMLIGENLIGGAFEEVNVFKKKILIECPDVNCDQFSCEMHKEFFCAGYHIIDRLLYAEYGSEDRSDFLDDICIDAQISIFVDEMERKGSLSSNLQKDEHKQNLNALVDIRNMDYGSCSELIPTEEKKDFFYQTAAWRFGENLSEAIGEPNNIKLKTTASAVFTAFCTQLYKVVTEEKEIFK